MAIDEPSAGITGVADRNAIVERDEEGIGIPVKWQMQSIMCVWNR